MILATINKRVFIKGRYVPTHENYTAMNLLQSASTYVGDVVSDLTLIFIAENTSYFST